MCVREKGVEGGRKKELTTEFLGKELFILRKIPSGVI